jgi:hypothetical protein
MKITDSLNQFFHSVHLSLKKIGWDPQKLQDDLKFLFGFNELQMEEIKIFFTQTKGIIHAVSF